MCARPRRWRSRCMNRTATSAGASIRSTRWCAANRSGGCSSTSGCVPRRQAGSRGRLMTTLTLYPAIDLKDGQCVRLKRGEMDQATVYSHDPGAQAKSWQDVGCQWLHVVDLNGAFAGRAVNRDAVERILKSVRIPIQLGGGIRDMTGIEAWLAAG